MRTLRSLVPLITVLALPGVAVSAEPLPAVAKLVNSGKAVIVDVRSEPEWKANHLAKAIWMPVDQVMSGKAHLEVLPKNEPVFVHCAMGPRARAAAKVMKEKGIDARPLDVGPTQLEKAGLEQAK